MFKKMISMRAKKAEGKTIVITIGSPIAYKQEIVECSDTVKEPARPFIELAKIRRMGV